MATRVASKAEAKGAADLVLEVCSHLVAQEEVAVAPTVAVAKAVGQVVASVAVATEAEATAAAAAGVVGVTLVAFVEAGVLGVTLVATVEALRVGPMVATTVRAGVPVLHEHSCTDSGCCMLEAPSHQDSTSCRR